MGGKGVSNESSRPCSTVSAHIQSDPLEQDGAIEDPDDLAGLSESGVRGPLPHYVCSGAEFASTLSNPVSMWQS